MTVVMMMVMMLMMTMMISGHNGVPTKVRREVEDDGDDSVYLEGCVHL